MLRGVPIDGCAIAEFLTLVLCNSVVGDLEPVPRLVDAEVGDDRVIGPPVLITDYEGNSPDHLDAGEPDVAEIARIELGSKRTGAEDLGFDDRLVGSKEAHEQ